MKNIGGSNYYTHRSDGDGDKLHASFIYGGRILAVDSSGDISCHDQFMIVRFRILMLFFPVDDIAHGVYIGLTVLQRDLERRANFDVTRGGEDTWIESVENRRVGACSAARDLYM